MKITNLFILSLMLISSSLTLSAKEYVTFVKEGKYFKLIDQNGQTLSTEQLQKVYNFYNHYAIVLVNGKWKYIDQKGKTFGPKDCKKLVNISEGKGAFYHGKKWGFINTNGDVIIQPTYQDVKLFENGVCWVKKGEKWFQVNEAGKEIFTNKFDAFKYFENGIARVRIGEKWGYIDEKGEYIAGGLIYERIEPFYNGKAFVKKNGNWGVINKSGEFIIKPSYIYASQFFKEGTAIVKDANNKAGVIDANSNILVPLQYEKVTAFKDGMCAGRSLGQWTVYNADGKKIATGISGFKDFREGKSIIIKDSKVGVLDKAGNISLLGKYDKISTFINGYAQVYKSEKWGYIDSTMKEIIAPKYIVSKPFFGDLAIVKDQNEKFGYINNKGDFIIPAKFEKAFEFEYNQSASDDYSCGRDPNSFVSMAPLGLGTFASKLKLVFVRGNMKSAQVARVKYNGNWAFINKEGNIVIDGLENAEVFINDYAKIRKDGKWGFITVDGEYVIKANYSFCKDMFEVCE